MYSKRPRTTKPRQTKRKGYKKKAKMNQLMSMVPVMKNYYDFVQGTSVPNSGVIFNLQNVLQGVGNSNRLGDTISTCSYYMRIAATAGDPTQYIRCWIVLDRSSNGAVPSLTDMFALPTGLLNIPQLVAINDRNRLRFKIIRDVTMKLDADDPIQMRELKGVFKRPLKSTYLSNSGSTDAFGQNQLYFVMVSDSPGTPHPFVQSNTRLYFLP